VAVTFVTDKKLHLIATAGANVVNRSDGEKQFKYTTWFNTAISSTEVSGSETDEPNYGSWFRHDTAATHLTLLAGSGNCSKSRTNVLQHLPLS
jgi:hypothetical protein